ncbi:hypothetical protein D854_gp20 [Streptomyces phage R4]|uniref:Uncharacterized protein n=1 Tax=Streptomyces phage R4 TaxID=10732 RepID=K4I010_9CAUD|nr:hypothetical protein D854_gp20 [Streptomyces phage R4]AFU62122.1 hypothetical protein R4_67.1 [Streptomyces phage R4]
MQVCRNTLRGVGVGWRSPPDDGSHEQRSTQ